LIAIGIFILLKLGYTVADNNDLKFLLSPTNYLVELVTNSSSQYNSESGHFHKELNIVIEKSCSGFNFWTLFFIMMSFMLLNFYKSNTKKIFALPLALFFSYFLTIFANTSRIILSIAGQKTADNFITPRPHFVLHEIIGTFVYLFFLIASYLVINFILKKNTLHHAKLA
jgi:exosortase K